MSAISLSDFFQSIEETLKYIFDSIRTEDPAKLDSAESSINNLSTIINSQQACNIQSTDAAKRNLGIRLDKITINLSRLINVLKNKTNKNIIFSEKALQEIEYLIGTIKHLSKCLKDATATKNDVLNKYIIETANTLENTAANFATEHKERLTGGICQAQASAIFIDLINTLKENSYHFKEMGRQISCFR